MILVRKNRGHCDVCVSIQHDILPIPPRSVVMFPISSAENEGELVTVTLCKEHAEEIVKEFDR